MVSVASPSALDPAANGRRHTGAAFTMQGYLHKLSHGMVQRWQLRYFEIVRGELRYYEKPFPRTSDKIKGTLKIAEAESCELCSEVESMCQFKVAMKDGFEMSLRAKTAATAQQWLEAIKTEQENAPAKATSLSLAQLDINRSKQTAKRHT